METSVERLRALRSEIVREHAHPDDIRGMLQVLGAIALLGLLWTGVAHAPPWGAVGLIVPISLITLRVFSLMHDCGHGVLCRSPRLNQAFGFILGVLAGMPQYVWARHHAYHHQHNGNWDRYRGPYTTLTLEEYVALGPTGQRLYRFKCSMTCAPLAGFIYLLFNPRYTWMRGTIGLVLHVVRGKLADPTRSLSAHAAGFETRYWKTSREYRHMAWNNLVLLALWVPMAIAVGPARFFAIYVASLSLAGAAGIVLFTVQHNFEHAYAGTDVGWDVDASAITGTSYLVLPAWLNWITADIAFHHIHHLCAGVPNYRLAGCHAQYRDHFADVRRIRLRQVPEALRYILWDRTALRLVSVEEFEAASRAAALPA